MTTLGDEVTATTGEQRVVAYPAPWRWVTAVLFALSRANLLLILGLVVLLTDPPITPPVLARLVVTLAALPGLAAWLIERAFAGTYELQRNQLMVRRRDLQVEIPRASIARIAPWSLPLPAPGVALRLRSGRRLHYSLQPARPTAFLDALAAAGVDDARTAAAHPTIVYAAARPPRRPWHYLLGKFVGFALLPASVLFYTHQHIAYGGALGEYYMYGLVAYLATFAIHWGTLIVYLILYASLWRALAEVVMLLAAWTAASHIAPLRHTVELVSSVAYYAGVPLMLAVRYLA